MKKTLTTLAIALAATSASAGQLLIFAKDRAGEPLANAVASLKPVDGKTAPVVAQGATATVSQKGFQFDPHVTVVQRGTSMRFPNMDKKDHHVKVLSGPTFFEFKIYTAKEPAPVVLDKLGKVSLYCLLHSNMSGHIFVVDTPYYGKSDGLGVLVLNDVPEGEYELTLDHPLVLVPGQVQPAQTSRVKIGSGKTGDTINAKFDLLVKSQVTKYTP
jgi:plastocyanin